MTEIEIFLRIVQNTKLQYKEIRECHYAKYGVSSIITSKLILEQTEWNGFYMEDISESKVTVLFEGNIHTVRDFRLPPPSR